MPSQQSFLSGLPQGGSQLSGRGWEGGLRWPRVVSTMAWTPPHHCFSISAQVRMVLEPRSQFPPCVSPSLSPLCAPVSKPHAWKSNLLTSLAWRLEKRHPGQGLSTRLCLCAGSLPSTHPCHKPRLSCPPSHPLLAPARLPGSGTMSSDVCVGGSPVS